MGLAEACIATGRKIEAIRILEEVAPVSNRPSAIYAKLARLYLEVRNPRGRNQALSRLRQYK